MSVPRRAWTLLCALAALLALAGCLGGGNSGSETTNGLAGVMRDGQHAPVSGARVLLLQEDHNGALPEGEAAPPETRTDRSGAYRFRDLPPGTYNLEVSDSASGGRSWVPGIAVSGDSAAAADGLLEAPGSIEVPVPDFLGDSKSGYLYLPGTSVYARVDSAARSRGKVVLEPVAPGRYPSLRLVVEENAAAALTLAEDVVVVPGERTLVAPFASWTHARNLGVSPPASVGAAPGLVTGYPLLVRLSRATFDFTQAAADGRDLRFTGPDGASLALEIERWDSAAGLAEVWVRLDTLRLGVPGQAITMHWGRPEAPSVSSGAGVFAPAASAAEGAVYGAVYHLAEAGNELPGGYRDATANGVHATAAGVNKTSLVEGAVGLAKSFAGELGTLSAPLPPGFGGNASFTVTFWMNAGMSPNRSSILDFGAQGKLTGAHALLRADTLAQFGAWDDEPEFTEGWAPWQNVFPMGPYLGKWTHVALVYDAEARKTSTWMDGTLVSQSDMTETLHLDPAGGLRIGKALSNLEWESDYTGRLDEVRLHGSVLPPERIRLDFETQKP